MKTTDSINIFADAHVFDSEFQGSRTFIKEIYTHLAGQKNITLFLAANNIENLKNNFPAAGNVHFIQYKSSSGFGRLLWEIPALIKKYAIEYAHFQYIVPPLKKCNYINTVHDVIFSDFPGEFSLKYRIVKKFLYKTSALKSDIITTVSDFSKASIQKYLQVKSPVHVISNGVSEKFFLPYNKQQSIDYIAQKYGVKKPVLYVSRIEQRKNHLTLLKAYLELELYSKGYHLVLLGHQSIKVPDLDKMLSSLPPDIKKFIYMSASVGDADLLEFYRAASVFVYPSRAEGFGIPPLEAAALNIPVICSNTSAMSDFTFFGDYHINPGNYDQFKHTLQAILTSPPDEKFLTKISEIIKIKYSWQRSAEKLYQLIVEHKNTTFAEQNINQ